MKVLAFWLVLALLAGLALGVASRAAMRVVALQSGVDPGFSAGGSGEVILFGAIVGAPAAMVYWICRWRYGLPTGSGVVAAVVLFLVMAAWPPPAARSALRDTPDTPLATAVLFALAFVVYGVVLDVLWRIREPR